MEQPNNSQNIQQRQARRAAIRKKRQQRKRQLQLIGLGLAAVLVIILFSILLSQCGKNAPTPAQTTQSTESTETSEITEVLATWQTTPAGRELTATQHFVYDCFVDTFLVIPEDADTRIYPASITKLITADLALQHLDPQDKITAGEALNLVAAGSSVADLKKGDTLTVAQLIGGMILPSGNDAACVLAAAAGRKILGQPTADATTAINAFVGKMNEQAQSMGLTNTHFANADGIHNEDHYTTYRDLVALAKQALSNPAITDYCNVASASLTTAEGRTLQWHNTNLLVDPTSQYYCPYAVGLKTGQTPYAGSCLLSAFEINGNTLIVGVFGCPDVESRFADTLQLLQPFIN